MWPISFIFLLYASLRFCLIKASKADLGFDLEPTVKSNNNLPPSYPLSGETTSATLPFTQSQTQIRVKEFFIQPSFTQSFDGNLKSESPVNLSLFPSETVHKNTKVDSTPMTSGEFYYNDILKMLESSTDSFEMTSHIEITSSSVFSYTSQPHISSENTFSTTDNLSEHAGWTYLDTMSKTDYLNGEETKYLNIMATTSLSSNHEMTASYTSPLQRSVCIPNPCLEDICTPLDREKYHCSCKQVYG